MSGRTLVPATPGWGEDLRIGLPVSRPCRFSVRNFDRYQAVMLTGSDAPVEQVMYLDNVPAGKHSGEGGRRP